MLGCLFQGLRNAYMRWRAASPWRNGWLFHKPASEDVTAYSTVDIATKIRCEAKSAAAQYIAGTPIFATGGIGYDFTFTITENNGLGASTSFLHPFTSGFGKFFLDVGASHDRQRQRERKFIIVETFQELSRTPCPAGDQAENWVYPITGTIGLAEVMKTFVGLDAQARQLKSFSDLLAFTTAFSASVRPKVQLSALAGNFRLTEASGTLAADRKDVHKVRIVLATTSRDLQNLRSRAGADGVKNKIMLDLLQLRSLDNTEALLDILRNR